MNNGCHSHHKACGHMMAFIHPDTFYTPFHWLSYQNDALSIKFMLDTLQRYKVEEMPHMI